MAFHFHIRFHCSSLPSSAMHALSDHTYKQGITLSEGFVNEKKQTLRDILTGDQYLTSPYKLEFLVNEDSEVVCEKNLTKEEVLKFQDAVAKDYYIQMYCDDMPIWTFIGRMDIKKKRYFLYMDLHGF
ncbi:hypothetical protein Peur_005474 [Populus x canadensis]